MNKSISPVVLERRPPEIGHIKIGGQGTGARKGGGKAPPVKFEHFVVTTRERGADGNFVLDSQVHQGVGEKPVHLDVRLMYPSVTENFFCRMQAYDGQRLVLECDGETCVRRDTGEEGPCRRGAAKGCECKPYGRLKVILEAAESFGGLHGFRTTSWETIRNIQSALEFFHEAFGTLRGLRLRMVAYPATDQVTQGGQDRQYRNLKVGLVLRGSFEEAARLALEYHQLDQLTRGQLRALAAGSEEEFETHDREDAVAIAAEFFPESQPGLVDGPAEGTEPAGDPEPAEAEGAPAPAARDPLAVARARYHALLAEVIPRSWTREDLRHAFHAVHPDLPDSEVGWDASHYEIAFAAVTRHGLQAFDRALERYADANPAEFDEIDRLKRTLDAGVAKGQAKQRMQWIVATGVGPWIRRELDRLRLGDWGEQEGSDEASAQGSLV
jgi:hypothetical protein